MTEKRSCCCGALPALWWWLLTLLGLPVLLWLMANARQGDIEQDLAARTRASLDAAGFQQVKASLQQRGRDVLLQGVAASAAARDQAVQVAQGVYGVRTVENRIEVGQGANAQVSATPVNKPLFALQLVNGKVLLEGGLSSRQEMADVIKTIKSLFGDVQIDNRLQVDTRMSPVSWVGALSSLLPAMQGVENASLNLLANGHIVVAGRAPSENGKLELLGKARQLLGSTVVDQVFVRAPTVVSSAPAQPASPVSGAASAQATAPVPEAMPVPPVVPEPGRGAVPVSSVPDAVPVPGAGTTGTSASLPSVQVPAGAVPQPASPAATPVPAVQQAVNHCQQQLDAAMRDQTILFETNQAVIKRTSVPLLDNLSGIIRACQADLGASAIRVSGHTDNVGNDAYNLKLSQQRADAVKAYLVGTGVTGGLLQSMGYGESQPVVSNATAEGRAQNRRITFDINPE